MNTIDTYLHLTELETERRRRSPVDHIRPLAKNRGGQAVGVVLTDMGSDGTLNLRRIKVGTARDQQRGAPDGEPRNRHEVEELDQRSSDLQNPLVATDIATLFLDRELRALQRDKNRRAEGNGMNLADYIATNKQRLILRWKRLADQQLALELESSELIDDLPDFIDDVVATLRDPSRSWPALESARCHGRQRMRHGMDMGSLTEEMGLIIEVICELGQEDGRGLTCDEMRTLTRVVSRGTAASVNAYAAMRDEELAREAGRHFSFVAHELRTPLQTARMAASLLSPVASGDEAKYLQRLERSLSRLSDLVDNSLVQVRLSGSPELHVRQVDAREIVENACEDAADHVEAKEQSLLADIQPFSLDADRKLLESALTNLLKNAVKFTPHGGSIRISARVEASRALFQVEDECGGMPAELPARLFQPFVQAHADKSGFGLGLMIVKQAAEAHEGTVHVLNRPGQGCVFVVDVPLVQSAKPPERVVP